MAASSVLGGSASEKRRWKVLVSMPIAARPGFEEKALDMSKSCKDCSPDATGVAVGKEE